MISLKAKSISFHYIIVPLICLCISGVAQVPFPDLVINNTTITTGTQIYATSAGIISPSVSTQPTSITQNAQVDFKGGTSVQLAPGFSASNFTGLGKFNAYITGSDFETVIMSPTSTPGTVGKLEKFELGINLPVSVNTIINDTNGLNPYDPDTISVEATFTSPTGVSKLIYGFYYHEYFENTSNDWTELSTNYHWRIRFAPDELGTWSCSINVISPLFANLHSNTMYFNCVSSGNKGYLEVGTYQRQLRYSETHTSFFAMGMNVPWANIWDSGRTLPNLYADQRSYIQGLHDNGANYFRLVLSPWSESVEFEKMGNYTKRQKHLWELDKIFDLAHSTNMYFTMCLENHGQYMNPCPFPIPDWSQNPYNSTKQNKITGINNPTDFFANVATWKYYKQRLRYIVSRWAYSTNLGLYELFSEINQVTGYSSHVSEVYNWQGAMADYVKNTLGEKKHLLSASYAGIPGVPDLTYFLSTMDVTSSHNYAYTDGPGLNYDSRWPDFNGETSSLEWYNKPYIFNEAGTGGGAVDNCTSIDFHNTIWSTAFMGGYGSAIYWMQWYNPVFWHHFIALSSFMNGEDFESDHYLPQKNKDTYSGDVQQGVESFTLKNSGGTRAIGFMQNRYSFWNTHPPCGTWPDYPTGHKDLIVKGLRAWPARFTIFIYRTPENGAVSLYDVYSGIRPGLTGTLRKDVFEPFQWAYDYAYKIVKTSDHSEISNNFPNDTLPCPNDTVRFDGILFDDTLGTQYNYSWNFGNGQTSTLVHPKVYYTSPGSYNVVVIATNIADGSKDTLTQTLVAMVCDSNNERIATVNTSAFNNSHMNFIIYPNPSDGIFILQANDQVDAEVEISDVLGKILERQHVNFLKDKGIQLDLTNNSKGIYFIRVMEKGNLVYSNKLIVQ